MFWFPFAAPALERILVMIHIEKVLPGSLCVVLVLAAACLGGCGTAGDESNQNVVGVTSQAASTSPACTPAPANVVGWWPGDGNAKNIVGGNNGTPMVNGTSSTGTFAAGEVGQAFSFDGTDEIVVPDAATLDPTQGLTIETWVYPASDSSSTDAVAMIVNKEADGAPNQYEIGRRNGNYYGPSCVIPSGNLAFYLGAIAGLPDECSGWVDGNALLPLNSWSHVALTFDGSNLMVYANGALTRQLAVSGTLLAGVGSLRIGARNDAVNNAVAHPYSPWVGLIDEMTLYNRGLSSSEIQAIYAAGSAGKCKRKKLVVFAQGINTTLTCDPNCSCVGSTNFGDIKKGLSAGDTVAWYSYQGGSYDSNRGQWCANSYVKDDTSRDLGDSTRLLYAMLKDIDAQQPNTDFYLIGHSQGGLIAFQGIASATKFVENSRIRAIVTLDAPLGYIPPQLMNYAAAAARYGFEVWGEPAATEMGRFYKTASKNSQQGTTAKLLCSLFHECLDDGFGTPITNGVAIQTNAARSDDQRVEVHTIGSDSDAVYDPRDACQIYMPGTGINDTSSQVVEGTDELSSIGGNVPQPSSHVNWATFAEATLLAFPPAIANLTHAASCVGNSHSAVLTSKAAEVIGVVDGN